MRSPRSVVSESGLAGLMAVAGGPDADRRMASDLGVVRLAATHASRTVILPTGGGMRKLPNLTALLAMLLVRFGVPALLHGAAGGDAARSANTCDSRNADSSLVTTADVLSRLGIRVASSVAQVQEDLVRERIACVATDVLAPGLAAHRSARTGLLDEMLTKLIDPFGGASYRVVGVDSRAALAPMRALLVATRADALLMRGCEGEPFGDPVRHVPLEDFTQGVAVVVASSLDGYDRALSALPPSTSVAATAAWISRVMDGVLPVPTAILTQLSCCLVGARRPLPQPMCDVP